MRAMLGVAIIVLNAVALAVGISEAQPALTQRDTTGSVTVVVTLTATPVVGTPLSAKIALDTHSVGLDGIAFEQAVVMRAADDREIAPRVESVTGSGHHRQAVVVFPAPAADGPVRLVVKNVGGVAQRTFVWHVAAR